MVLTVGKGLKTGYVIADKAITYPVFNTLVSFKLIFKFEDPTFVRVSHISLTSTT